MPEKVQVLQNPPLQSALALVREALAKHKCILILGSCNVEYQGRARSTLEMGERIVLIKEDGATLIHRSTGYEPVNWQPSGCYFRTSLNNGTLLLQAIRRRPVESIKIFFETIYTIVVTKMVDFGRFDLHVSEKEMQTAILAEPELLEAGFRPLAYEKKVEPGFVDIYGLDLSNKLVVVEIKRVRAGKSAVLQLAHYVEKIKNTAGKDVRGVLAAPQISKGTQRLLATLHLEFKAIDLQKCARAIKVTPERKIRDFL
ncbi:MAG: endonuclease NucS [Candidatus Bathyarchaeota archaeon]